MRIASVGHLVFAVTMVALGVLGLITGDFTAPWQPVPNGAPAREVLVYLGAVISLGSGMGLLWPRTAARAARVLLASLLLSLVALRLPAMFWRPGVETSWPACSTAVMVAGAWVLYTWFATDEDRRRFGFAAGDTGVRIARILYGLALVPFGLAHFAYLENTAPLVPGWLPWPVFWSYFTGWTFIVAGVAVLIGVCAGLAVALSAWQMGLFLLLVWVPRMAAGSLSAFQRTEVIVNVALVAAAWAVADSYRGTPWLAVDRR
jgi:uncharacterized membrane protein